MQLAAVGRVWITQLAAE